MEEDFPHVKSHHHLIRFIERYDLSITATFGRKDWKYIKSHISFSLDVKEFSQIDNLNDYVSSDEDNESVLELLRSGDSDEDLVQSRLLCHFAQLD